MSCLALISFCSVREDMKDLLRVALVLTFSGGSLVSIPGATEQSQVQVPHSDTGGDEASGRQPSHIYLCP